LVPFATTKAVDTEVVIAYLDAFCKTLTRPTVVVLDNASMHRAKAVKSKVPMWEKQGLSLYFLPEYAPELNLIEILWRFIKYAWLPFSAYVNFEALCEAVEEILTQVGTKYQIAFREDA